VTATLIEGTSVRAVVPASSVTPMSAWALAARQAPRAKASEAAERFRSITNNLSFWKGAIVTCMHSAGDDQQAPAQPACNTRVGYPHGAGRRFRRPIPGFVA